MGKASRANRNTGRHKEIIAINAFLESRYRKQVLGIVAVIVSALPLLSGLLLTGCGATKSNGARLNASRALQVPVLWESLQLVTDSRAVIVNNSPSFVTIPRYARSIEIRLQSTADKSYAEVVNRPDNNSDNSAVVSQFVSREDIKLTDIGGPLALSGGDRAAKLLVRCYSGENGQGALVAETSEVDVKIRASEERKYQGRAVFVLETEAPLPITPKTKIRPDTVRVAENQQFPAGIIREVQVVATTEDGNTFTLPLGSFAFSAGLLGRGFQREAGRLRSLENVPASDTIPVNASMDANGLIVIGEGGSVNFTRLPKVRVSRISASTIPNDDGANDGVTDPYPLVAGTARLYTATVENFGSDSNAVTWTINRSGATISNDGEFRATEPGIYTLTATSRIEEQEFTGPIPANRNPNSPDYRKLNKSDAETRKTTRRNVTVTVIANENLIALTADPARIPASSAAKTQAVALTAVTEDGFDVNWSVDEPDGGIIRQPAFTPVRNPGDKGVASAIYQAPQRGGTFTVRATSLRDPAISRTIKIVVQASSATVKID